VQRSSSGRITASKFIKNYASFGAVLFLYVNCSLHILSSAFDSNDDKSSFDNFEFASGPTTCITTKVIGDTPSQCRTDRGIIALTESLFSIANSTFINNHATSGVITAFKSNFSITNSTYVNNRAKIGGVVSTFSASFNISDSLFSKNLATFGGVACTFESSFSIFRSNFTNNTAYRDGGVLYTASTLQEFNVTIANSTFSENKANYGGIACIIGTMVDMINGKFYQNSGSFYAFSCNITFRGVTTFEKCTEPSLKHNNEVSRKEGGAITSYHSIITFTGASTLLNNQAEDGGAIVAIDSHIIMWDEIMISSNIATSGSGGGIYLIQCDFFIHGNCNFYQNHASETGGGAYASSSSIVVQEQGDLRFISNRAENGGGVYLEINSRLVTVSKFPGIWSEEHEGENGFVMFVGNNAENGSGGAIYIKDEQSVSCFFSVECFIQSVVINKLLSDTTGTESDARLIFFSGNTASHHGSNIFGGLFDRCIPSPFATVYADVTSQQYHCSGIEYLQNISNITLDSIASDPVQVCFCNNMSQPNCSYEAPTIKVKKGEPFSITIAAVDQVNHFVNFNASIRSLLMNNTRGRMDEGQQMQIVVSRKCTQLTYSVFSPDDSEIILLFADGPCMASTLSRKNVNIQFLGCTCSTGFEPFPSNSKCECVCNSTLTPYVTKCDPSTDSVFRANTTSWITYINDTDPPGFVIYPICPLDYCYPQSENVSINFNLPTGSDAQCAHNRSGILCGACQPNLSLSLGSSRCLPCSNLWPLAFIAITFTALIAGVLLVTVILVLNMTVADGMINAIIFYTDITAPFDRIVRSSAAPNVPTVFLAWLNLNIGFDICFFKGLDSYYKTWLQLLFPAYIISLVVIVIKISKYSPRFTRLISARRRDPVATLATLILLSYAKLLSTTISVLSYATLTYPDGSKSVVWLVDGSVQYLQGKHIALVIAVVLIVLIGVPYTFFLFFWQWLIRIPKIKLNRWTRLNSIITVYHAPYNDKHRYWSGLLLLVRVVLYITVALTVSSNPQIPLLMTVILVGGLLFHKGVIGTGLRLYKRSSVDIVETIILLNLLLFAALSGYNFKSDSRKETAIMYVSTGTVFLLLIGEIVFKIIFSTGVSGCIKRKICSADHTGHHTQLLAPLIHSPSLSSEVTHSSLEISLPTPSPSEQGSNDFESERESTFVK
jgi:predicted outer membrane repeat protein